MSLEGILLEIAIRTPPPRESRSRRKRLKLCGTTSLSLFVCDSHVSVMQITSNDLDVTIDCKIDDLLTILRAFQRPSLMSG